MQYVKLTVRTQVRHLIEGEKVTLWNTMKFIPIEILLPVALGLALLAPVAQAANYNPATTLVVYIHGFDADGWNSTWLAGDDSTNNDACGMWGDVQTLAAVMGAPTWLENPTAPNCLCAATYYGSTLPAWYSAQDIADDNALSGNPVPQYALRMAKYIRHCLNRAPGATSVHVMSASFGGEIARYMIEHNLLDLCSDGMISRWSSVVGVLRGNWLASTGSNLYLLQLGEVFGVNHADDPDIPQMNYSWVDADISAHNTMNSPYYGPMVISQLTATDDDAGYITDVNNNANDNMNMNTDEYFAGYTTTAALHPATDGTLQMPGLAYYRNTHTGIRDNAAMWASLAAAAQGNQRVTITLSRLKAKVADGWPYNNGEWVYHATVVSPRSAALYGNTMPISELAWEDGVSPLFSVAKNATIYPNTALFDMIIPPGETQLQVTFTLEKLENQYTYYDVVRLGYGGNTMEGTFTLNISTTEGSTVTVSNSKLQADLTTTVKSVYCAPTITCPADVTVSANAGCTATSVALGSPVTGDNCSVVSVTSNAPAVYPLGTNVVTWTVTDASGTTATCAQTVTVVPSSSCINLAISSQGGMIRITWDAGVLQQADDVHGTYTDVPGAASPYTITITGSAPQKFYRVRGTGP